MHLGKHKQRAAHWVENVNQKFYQYKDALKNSFSIIIPTYNCAERIGKTLDSLKQQQYPQLEVIIIDAGSSDKTLDIVTEYYPLVSRIYSVPNFNLYDMLNRGSLLASNQYLNFLFPGAIYTSKQTLENINALINSYHTPELIYCCSFLCEAQRETRMVCTELDVKHLEQGKQPATIAACWIQAAAFESLGKFNNRYQERSAFDFFIRFLETAKFKWLKLERGYVEVDLGNISYASRFRYAAETGRIITKHFGIFKGFVWFLGINHLAIFKVWLRSKRKKIS